LFSVQFHFSECVEESSLNLASTSYSRKQTSRSINSSWCIASRVMYFEIFIKPFRTTINIRCFANI